MTIPAPLPTCQSPVNPITISDDECTFYQAYGYLPLPGLINPDALAGLRSDVYEVLESVHGITAEDLASASSTQDKLRQCSRYRRHSNLDAVINAPAMLAVASRLIGGPARRYLPFTAVKSAGGGPFHLHQDNNYTEHRPALGSINIWVALVDMTPSNGCLRVGPGSHRHGQAAASVSPDGDHRAVIDEPDLVVPLRMRAGDAVAFSRLTVHGSGANRSDAPRLAYALQYHREDVSYRDPADETWKRLSEQQRWSTGPVERLTD